MQKLSSYIHENSVLATHTVHVNFGTLRRPINYNFIVQVLKLY